MLFTASLGTLWFSRVWSLLWLAVPEPHNEPIFHPDANPLETWQWEGYVSDPAHRGNCSETYSSARTPSPGLAGQKSFQGPGQEGRWGP